MFNLMYTSKKSVPSFRIFTLNRKNFVCPVMHIRGKIREPIAGKRKEPALGINLKTDTRNLGGLLNCAPADNVNTGAAGRVRRQDPKEPRRRLFGREGFRQGRLTVASEQPVSIQWASSTVRRGACMSALA